MASIDAARALLARDGEDLCAPAAARSWRRPADRLRQVPGLDVLDGPGVEPTKLVVLLAGTGAHGIAVEADLIAAGMPVEMADRDTIIPIVTMADDEAAGRPRSPTCPRGIVEAHRGAAAAGPVPAASWTVVPEMVMPPREAFFCPNETRLRRRGRRPGERRTGRALPAGRPGARPGRGDHADGPGRAARGQADGGRIAYAADPTLATFQVIARP